jgi:hypothetical protein
MTDYDPSIRLLTQLVRISALMLCDRRMIDNVKRAYAYEEDIKQVNYQPDHPKCW